MISIIADTHTHTMACDHAYSTLTENARAAAEKGLRFLAATEHSPSMPGGPSEIHFANLHMIPRQVNGVTIIRGVEVNIMDYNGSLDLSDYLLDRLEWVIASMHRTNLEPSSKEDHTRGWLEVANNPLVDVVGHCGDPRYGADYPAIVREFSRTGKIVEINAHSKRGRPGSADNCREVALLCAEHGVPVVVSSDAHFWSAVGRFDDAVEMLEEIHFPQELILNADYQRFLQAARQISGKMLTE